MIAFLHRWRTTLLLLPAVLVLGGIAWVCIGIIHGLGAVMSDGTEFEYDHNLPRGYESKTVRNLETLQVAAIAYAQRHKGVLPPMQTSAATLSSLRAGLGWRAKYYFRNPATGKLFTPNAALSDQKWGACLTAAGQYCFTMPTRRRVTAKATTSL